MTVDVAKLAAYPLNQTNGQCACGVPDCKHDFARALLPELEALRRVALEAQCYVENEGAPLLPLDAALRKLAALEGGG